MWRLRGHPLGAQHWLSLEDIHSSCPPWDVALGQGVQCTLQLLSRTAKKLNLSPYLLFRRTLSGKDDVVDMFRCISGTIVSTTGLVLFASLQAQARAKQKGEKRASYQSFLEQVLNYIFADRDILLRVSSDKACDCDVSVPPGKAYAVDLLVSGGMVQLWGLDDPQLVAQVHGVSALPEGATEVPFVKFLCDIIAHRVRHARLASQLLVGVGMWLDDYFARGCLQKGALQAAIAGAGSAASLDPEFADSLALGNLDGAKGVKSVSVAPLCRSAMAFKTVKRFDLAHRWSSILLRHWMVGREAFHKQGKLVIAADASRFQLDTLVGVMGGMDKAIGGEGQCTTMVLPPQALCGGMGRGVICDSLLRGCAWPRFPRSQQARRH